MFKVHRNRKAYYGREEGGGGVGGGGGGRGGQGEEVGGEVDYIPIVIPVVTV